MVLHHYTIGGKAYCGYGLWEEIVRRIHEREPNVEIIWTHDSLDGKTILSA